MLLEKSIVRIHSTSDSIIGVGFLVNKTNFLTAAHVVRDALNLSETPHKPPKNIIQVDFPYINSHKLVNANVCFWQPDYDIAGFELIGYSPSKARPARLFTGSIEELIGHQFQAIGFPQYFNKTGVWAYGTVRNKRPDGTVQLQITSTDGEPVQKGFSGGPIWDRHLQEVIGMVVRADKEVRLAFMYPSSTINQLCSDVIISTPKTNYINVPTIVVAMTREEAKTLVNQPLNPNFDKFKTYFNQSEVDEWLKHYQTERTDWQPHVSTESGIREIVFDMVDEININREREKIELIRPNFLCHKFFDETDVDTQDEIWTDLREAGGIVIVDTLSLFHPKVKRIFDKANIVSHSKVAVIGLTPLRLETMRAYNVLVEQVLETGMHHVLSRFNKYDKFIEFGLKNIPDLERWLFQILPKTADAAHQHQSNPDKLAHFSRIRKRSKKKIERFMFGKSK